MPVIGIGLHLMLAILCAIHVVRTGQQLYWLFVLFSFPILGSVVYFLAVYLPGSRLESNAFKAVAVAGRALDPTREIRNAQAQVEASPTVQNRMQLAEALLDAGEAQAAADEFATALQGAYAQDPELRFGLARALLAAQQPDQALVQLETLTRQQPEFRTEPVQLLRARSLAASGQHSAAETTFQQTVAAFNTYESRAEYAIWALSNGQTATAQRLEAELQPLRARWNRMTRQMNAGVERRYQAARRQARTQ